MELNQSNTAHVFLQRLILAAVDVSLTILCNICLLIRPISDFVGLINRHVGALSKLGLWSLSVIKQSHLAMVSTLSEISSSSVIFFASVLISVTWYSLAFLYIFCMFTSNFSLYCSGLIL